jgi:hypothetical protein
MVGQRQHACCAGPCLKDFGQTVGGRCFQIDLLNISDRDLDQLLQAHFEQGEIFRS